MMRHSVFVVGTRAQLVKVAPVLTRAVSSDLPHSVWLAGQHTESIDDLIRDFQLTSPVVNAQSGIERSSIFGLLRWLPGALIACRRYIRDCSRESGRKPLVVVHGDTMSAFVGAIAGYSLGADIAHLESGLSSGRLFDPFPEELTRRIVFRITDWALCPNDEATRRMQRRGCREVVDTGENTLLDCVRFALSKAPASETQTTDYFVASIHRFQNIYSKARLTQIIDELISAAELSPVRFVLHPATESRLRSMDLLDILSKQPAIQLDPRMSYTAFLSLIAGARAVFTDGGSNQEELSYLGIPTVLYRERSERPDGLGKNVRFRSQIIGDLASWITAGHLEEMRQPSRIDDEIQPSDLTVAALARWATVPAPV